MSSAEQQLTALMDLDARHDDLLKRLTELDERVAAALASYQPPRIDGLTDADPNGGGPDGRTC